MTYNDKTGCSYFESDTKANYWNSLYAADAHYYSAPKPSTPTPKLPIEPLPPVPKPSLTQPADNMDTSPNPAPSYSPSNPAKRHCLGPCNSYQHHHYIEECCHLPQQCHHCWNKKSGKQITWCLVCT
jgi:hypothetical protein